MSSQLHLLEVRTEMLHYHTLMTKQFKDLKSHVLTQIMYFDDEIRQKMDRQI